MRQILRGRLLFRRLLLRRLGSVRLDNLGERVVHATLVAQLANLGHSLVNTNGLTAVLGRSIIAEANVNLPALDLLVADN